jgi:predicted chitinase
MSNRDRPAAPRGFNGMMTAAGRHPGRRWSRPMPTLEQLRLIMPDLPAARAAGFLPFLEAAMAEFAIGTPARAAAFLAQIAHESGQLRFMEEIWGPTAAQGRYEPVSTLAANLGNTAPGDGRRFKGRGPIQLTGRANYQRFGELLKVDLVGDPDQAAKPPLAFRTAALFWMKNGLNQLADQANGDAFKLITRRINGGLNGLADRQRFYTAACRVLGVATPSPGSMRSVPLEPPAAGLERGAEAVRLSARRPPSPRRTVGTATTKRPAARKAAAGGPGPRRPVRSTAKPASRGKRKAVKTPARKKTARKATRKAAKRR